MLQPGKDLPFLAESFPKQIGGKGQVDQFDGDLLLELPIGAMRQIDGAHAAASQQAIKQEGTDSAWIRMESSWPALRLQAAGCRELLFRFASLEQRTNLGGKFLVPLAASLNQFRARFKGGSESLVKDRLNPLKAFRRLFHIRPHPRRHPGGCGGTASFW